MIVDYRDGPAVFHDEEDDRFLPQVNTRGGGGGGGDGIINRSEFRETVMDRITDTLQNHCDPWKIVPTLIVSNAFSCSLTVLTLCTLAELRVQHEPDPIGFGLWSYSDPDRREDGTLFIPSSLNYARTCRQYTDTEGGFGPQIIFLDPKFRMARTFGVMAVVFGFLTMAALWIGVIRDHESTTNWRRWVGVMLLFCCFFEGMTLMILQTGVCDSQDHGIYRECLRGRGSNTVITACVLWFVGGLMLVKWPRAKEYEHSTLAGDEADEAKHPRPETVMEESFFSEMWKSLEEEQDSQQSQMNVELSSLVKTSTAATAAAVSPSGPVQSDGRRKLPPPPPPERSPSILDLISPLDSEIDYYDPTHSRQEADLPSPTKRTARVVEEGGIQPQPQPQDKSQPKSLQELREQSAIQTQLSATSIRREPQSQEWNNPKPYQHQHQHQQPATWRTGTSQVIRVSSWAARLAQSREKSREQQQLLSERRLPEHSRAALHDILASFDDM